MLALPLYIAYFDNNTILGVWFTLLSVLNWVLYFDVGIGNGLRNHLTISLADKNFNQGKRLVSSSYMVLGVIAFLISIFLCLIVPYIDWNSFFNISSEIISSKSLQHSILVTLIGVILSFFLNLVRGMLFALQLPSVVNFISLISSILNVSFLFLVQPIPSLEGRLELMAYAYAIFVNLPLVVSTIWVFTYSELKKCRPSFTHINIEATKQVVGLGVSFFVIQILYMVITVTNEWFISYFFSPDYIVEYQVYFRIFSLVGTLLLLALTPLWSAITKAYAERRFVWIVKLHKILYILAFIFMIIEVALIPFLQPIIDYWLKTKPIVVEYHIACAFAFYGIITIWNAIQSTIVSGLGILKIQLGLYLFAALLKVIFIAIYSSHTNHWEIVMWISAVGLIPFSLIQPFFIKKSLKKMC